MERRGKGRISFARRVRDLERRLERFWSDHPGARVNQVSEAIAKEWLEKKHQTRRAGQKGSAKLTAWGRNNYLRDFQMFFEWCVAEKSWCASNPFARIKKDPVKRREDPEIYTAEEAKKLIDTAIANPKLELLAYYALGRLSASYSPFQRGPKLSSTWMQLGLHTPSPILARHQ
jgi:hypothetical protein